LLLLVVAPALRKIFLSRDRTVGEDSEVTGDGGAVATAEGGSEG
jgi:hypothetical protein